MLELPPVLPLAIDDVEAILDYEIGSTASGGFQQFLVRWKGRSQFNNSWLCEDDLRRSAPDLLDGYLHANSLVASLSKLTVLLGAGIAGPTSTHEHKAP